MIAKVASTTCLPWLSHFFKFQNKSDFPIIISQTHLSFCQFIITFPTILYHVLISFPYVSHHFPSPQKKHGPRAAGALPKPDLSGEAPNDLPFAKGELPGPGPMAEPYGEIMGKHGGNMGQYRKSWENHGKIWDNPLLTTINRGFHGGILGRSCGIFHREMKKEVLPANYNRKTMKQPKCGNHNGEII